MAGGEWSQLPPPDRYEGDLAALVARRFLRSWFRFAIQFGWYDYCDWSPLFVFENFLNMAESLNDLFLQLSGIG